MSIKPEPKKNDANAFVTPRRNKNAVARTKMTPNDTGMCIDVIKRSYMIYLRCLKIFCMRTLVFWTRLTMIAEFACQGLEQKQQWTRSEALLRASRTCLDQEGSFWLDANDRFELLQIWGSKEITRKTEYVLHRVPVERLAIMTRKVWGEKSPWVGFAAFPEPLGEGEQWYSSYYVHVSITSYSELTHREFPDHRTPR